MIWLWLASLIVTLLAAGHFASVGQGLHAFIALSLALASFAMGALELSRRDK
jgi:hypothetical protein